MQTCRRARCAEGFKAALPTRYKGLVNVPDPPTELMFGDLNTRMKDLDGKAKLEDALQSAPPPKFTKVSVPRATARMGQFPLPFVLLRFKKLASFPHNGQPVNDFGETTQMKGVFPPLVVDQLADISRRYETWADITTDSFVLDIVKHGITLAFCSQAFCSNYTPRCSLTAECAKAVDAEIKLLLLKHVISPAELKADSFVPSIFTTMKPDGSHQTILNLKNLNESITYVHFKMESLKHVRQLIKPDSQCSCESSLLVVFYLLFGGVLLCVLCMPNGYAQAPLLFTKLLKQPFSFLQKHGYASVIYIDDSYL